MTANGKAAAIMGAGVGLSVVNAAAGGVLTGGDGKIPRCARVALLAASLVATFLVTRAVVKA